MGNKMWAPDETALKLLDTDGGPFGTSAFREAMVETVAGWRDVSFGAETEDGAVAAIPLLARRFGAESMPPEGYGGVVASRPLEAAETTSFLELAARRLRLPRLTIRSLELADSPVAGTRLVPASVVRIDRREPPGAQYARLARRSLKRARDAGAAVTAGDSGDAFWPVYAEASRAWEVHYPEPLVRRLVDTGVARVHTVRMGGRVVAALLTLVGRSHWMCWLAGQSDEGRAVSASYLAYDAVFQEAHAAGVPAVNLGASVGGGAEFKRHLGAVEVWMRGWTHEGVAAAAVRKAYQGAAALTRAARARLA
jgi:Acetyltransferase (GNAT) domain